MYFILSYLDGFWFVPLFVSKVSPYIGVFKKDLNEATNLLCVGYCLGKLNIAETEFIN
jgi:hypothetical protein